MWYSIIGMGATCFASTTDNETVLKGYEVWEGGKQRAAYARACEDALAREDLIYSHLGKHPQILKCFGLEEISPGIHSLRLELAPLGNVRQFIEDHADPLPVQDRLQMALDVARGVAYIHSRKVQHSDLSCRNFFLFKGFRVKIGDFGASLIEGHNFEETVYEESRYELPCRGRDFDDRPAKKRELFALGSAIYEIMAWQRPYQELEEIEVEKLYAHDKFPPLDCVAAGNVVSSCWKEEYEMADDAALLLEELIRTCPHPVNEDAGVTVSGNVLSLS